MRYPQLRWRPDVQSDSPHGLSVLVPATGTSLLRDKLTDLCKLSAWVTEVVVCFNGVGDDLEALREILAEPRPIECLLSISSPFNKAIALRQGLNVATSARILYTDVDCLIYGVPEDIQPVIDSSDVCSFLVLRAPARSCTEVRAKLLRRKLLGKLCDAVGLLYLSARGGGYVAGNLAESIDERVLSDDLLFPAEYAATRGVRIVPSEALVFYESRSDDERRYADKLPRLIYGSAQAFRLARSPRVRASLAVEKLTKYVVVAATPIVLLCVLAAVGLPLWIAAVLLVRARLFVRTWEGLGRGIWNAPPRW